MNASCAYNARSNNVVGRSDPGRQRKQHPLMKTKHWKCATSDRCSDVYITTSDGGDLAGHSERQITEAHLHEAREAFFYYSLRRGLVLMDIREVSAVPRVRTEVAVGNASPTSYPFSILATVYEVSPDAEVKEDPPASAGSGKNGGEDGLDSERREVLEHSKMQLLEVIYSLEGLLDEENENYRALPQCLQGSAGGGDAGRQRQIIESAIRLLYDGYYALADEIRDATPLLKAI